LSSPYREREKKFKRVSASFELKLEREREIFSILYGFALHVLGWEERALDQINAHDMPLRCAT
jgi:hypothetical protein